MFTVVVLSAGDQWVVDICLMLITSKPRFTNPSEMSSVGYHSLYRLLRFVMEGEVWEVIALELRADGWKFCHFFCDNPGTVLGVTEFKSCLSVSLSVAFAIVSRLLERLVQWEVVYLPGWMVPDVAGTWWCCPCCLRGQLPFQLTSMRQRCSG
jgi:hypothetical protein